MEVKANKLLEALSYWYVAGCIISAAKGPLAASLVLGSKNLHSKKGMCEVNPTKRKY
jgi:hypothetical protein